MSTELILKALAEQSARLTNIEAAIVKLAKQDDTLLIMQKQLDILFSNYDLDSNPKDGVAVGMKEYPKGSHGKETKVTMNRQWAAICLLATITTWSMLKVFGAF
jgi:hypothetical protein